MYAFATDMGDVTYGNLSPKLIRRLAPGLETVYDHDLTNSSDPFIFDCARRFEFSARVSRPGLRTID
jgi:hypothetical protein